MFQTSGSQAKEKLVLFYEVLCVQAHTELQATHINLLLSSEIK